jgi:hypothetical protein
MNDQNKTRKFNTELKDLASTMRSKRRFRKKNIKVEGYFFYENF